MKPKKLKDSELVEPETKRKPKPKAKRKLKKSESKVIELFSGLKTKTETNDLSVIRKCLSPVDQFVFDRCIEGLSTLKAVSSWVGLMKMLNELNDKAEIANVETETLVDWDVSATEGIEFKTSAG